MANTVIALKKSSVPTAQPTVLANGELAINYADGKLFYKHANGTILPFNTQGGNAFGTINANGTLVVAGSSEAVVSIIAGNNISIVGDAINDRITISATGGGANVAVSTSQIKDLTSNDYVITSVTPVSQVVDSALMSAAFDKANAANVLAFNTGIGANAYAASIANTIAIAAYDKANTGGGGYFAGNRDEVGASNYGDIFRVHSNTLTQNVTIYSGNNAICAGPITISGAGTTLTIQTGARVVIA